MKTIYRLEDLKEALARSQKHPALGVTQGGSSRKNGGARVAARDANIQRQPTNQHTVKGANTNG